MLTPRFAPTPVPVLASKEKFGWPDDIWSPSGVQHDEGHAIPNTLTTEGIETIIQDFADAAKRAVKAGVDFIEIHGAHGYLIHQFLSPLTNTRTDDYGGSFENRTRFALRVTKAIRSAIPEHIALSFRVSATEWMEWSNQPSWDFEQTVELARLLPEYGADVVDVSSGGHRLQKLELTPRYQIDFAQKLREILKAEGVNLLVASVGFIDSPEVALDVTQEVPIINGHQANDAANKIGQPAGDLALVGRQFLRESGFVLRTATELHVPIQLPFQYERALPKST